MSRPLRIEFAGAVYHLTSRGNARQRIFADDQDRERFLGVLGNVVDRYKWLCHAYCLMDNHYHLIIETPRTNLSLGMRQLNGIYTQVYNRRHRRVGHLFQGRFKAILVERDAYLLELCRYVVLNPVRARVVRQPGQWKWSSYRATAGLVPAPRHLTVDWVLSQFGSESQKAKTNYRRYVEEASDVPSPWEKLKGQVYLGSDEFVAKYQPGRLIREIPRRQTQARRPSLRELFGGRWSTGVAIVSAYREYGYRLAEIANHLEVHYSTISRHLRKAEGTRDV